MTKQEIALAALDEALGHSVQKRFEIFADDPGDPRMEAGTADEYKRFRRGLILLAKSYDQARAVIPEAFKE